MITNYYSTARSKELVALDQARVGSWIYVVGPSGDELKELADKFHLDEDLLLDALDPYESPRVEQEDDTTYVFTRYYLPDIGSNATDTMLIIYKRDYIITIMRSNAPVLQRLTRDIEPVVTTQKTKLLLQILEEVNDSYRQYVTQVTKQLFAIRSRIKHTDISSKTLLNFIGLEDDLNEFSSALQPQAVLLRNLLNERYLRLYEDDKDLIEDLTLSTGELIELVRSRVKTIVNIRQAYEAVATNELNKIFRRLTSITIFLMIPTLVFSLYGMNVGLPFGNNPQAFWFIMATVTVVTAATIYAFNRRRWL